MNDWSAERTKRILNANPQIHVSAYRQVFAFPKMLAAIALPFPIISILVKLCENSLQRMNMKAQTGMIPEARRHVKNVR